MKYPNTARYTLFFTLVSLLSWSVIFAATNPSPDTSVLLPENDHGSNYVVPMWVEIDESTPSITLNLYRDGDYQVFRRVFGESEWGPILTILAPGTFSWTDTNVTEGVIYEYAVFDTSPSVIRGSVSSGLGVTMGYQLASIRADQDKSRGIVILAIADTVITGNESKLHRLVEDLVGDGWKVRIVYANSHYDDAWDFDDITITSGYYGYDSVRDLRRQIQRIYNEHPAEVKMLYCLGHVPFAQTGLKVDHLDNHGRRSAYMTDFIYADVDGQYTDSETSDPSASIDGSKDASRTASHVPWDGIYDQNNMLSQLELGVGRVDPFNVPGATDAEHLSVYLDKAHNYRHVIPYGMAGSESTMNNRAGFRWNGGGQTGAVATSMQLLSIFGPSNMANYIPSHHLPDPVAPNTDKDVQYIIDTGPYLFYAQNSAKPPSIDHGSTAAHRLSMQSNWGDWWDHQNNQSITDILRDTNMTLTWLYTGRYSPQFLNYPLGLGFPYGEVLKLSANNEHGEYFTGIDPIPSVAVREFIHSFVGDPTLRLFPVEPISNLTAAVVSNTVELSWTAPADLSNFEEYRVYRSDDLMGDFQLIASGISNTQFTDTSPLSGSSVYMVKAVHLVENGSGSFLNNAQGIFATVGMTVDTTVLPSFPVGEDAYFSFQVSSTAGAPTWSLVSGDLPLGMTLASDGSLSGKPISPGHYDFELEVTDGVSTLRRSFAAFVDSAETLIANVDLRENGGGLADKTYYQRNITVHGDPQWDPEGGMIFDGVGDAVQLHDLANETFPDYTLFPSMKSNSNGFALMAAFKADPSSSGGVILSKATNLETFWQDNLSQYAIEMTPTGQIKSWLNWVRSTSSQSYNDGQWHTLAFVREGGSGTLNLYIDGVLEATSSISGTWFVSEDFLIGARWDGDEASGVTDVFEGSIADVMVYKTGITEGEVVSIHERRTQSRPGITPHAPVLSGLPSLLQFEDASIENTFSLPFDMSDANGEPVKPVLIATDPSVWAHLAVDATDSGYVLNGRLKGDLTGLHQLRVLADDGWPGMTASHLMQIEVAGVVDDVVALSVSGGSIDVLANDVPLAGETFHLAQISSQPSNGYARIENGKVSFYPDVDWNTVSVFNYTVHTESGMVLEAEVRVSPTNAPSAQDDNHSLSHVGTELIDVLSNDTDPLNETLTIVRVHETRSGIARVVGNQIEYTPAVGQDNVFDSFEYTVVNESGYRDTAVVDVSYFDPAALVPVIAYDFDEGSGVSLGNHGSLVSAPMGQIHGSVAWEAHNGGHALVLDGSTTYVDLGNPAEMSVDPSTDSFSFAMSLKPSDYLDFLGNVHTLLSKESGTGSNDQFALELGYPYTWKSIIKSVHPDFDSTEDSSVAYYGSPHAWRHLSPIAPNWHSLIYTYDADLKLIRLYVDNWLVSETTLSTVNAAPDNALNWILGARRDGSGGFIDHFAGSIDDFQFFDYALSLVDVKGILQAQNFPITNMGPVHEPSQLSPLESSELKVGETYIIRFPIKDIDSSFEVSVNYWDPSSTYHYGTFENEFAFTPELEGLYRIDYRYRQNDGTIVESYNHRIYYTVGSSEVINNAFTLDAGQELQPVSASSSINQTLNLVSGLAPYAFSAQNLPSGLSLNASTGELTGSIAAEGNYVFSVTVTDANTDTDTRSYLLKVVAEDADNDGLADSWETLHVGDLSLTPAMDGDGDGRPALIEFAAGSLPDSYDASSLIRMKRTYGPPVNGSDRYMELEFDRKSNLPISMTYKVQVSSDMFSWSDVSEAEQIISDDGTIQKVQLRVPMGVDTRQFYRIQVQHSP